MNQKLLRLILNINALTNNTANLPKYSLLVRRLCSVETQIQSKLLPH